MTVNVLLAPRPVELDGQRLGLLESGAGRSSVFLDLLTAKLEKRHFLTAVLRVGKPDDQPVSSPELLGQVAEQCDVVILGVCSSIQSAQQAAIDAGVLEKLSVPCAIVLSADFRAARSGVPGA